MTNVLPHQDQKLVQILDAALASAELRSGEWLICKPGCTPCCIGVFAIDQLDALRLQAGLAELEADDPQRAAQVRARARESLSRLTSEFPGDVQTGVLTDDDEAAARFEEFANFERCPALDPQRGTCDLYRWRPVTCRVFGPPVRSDGGLGVCELCYHGASTEEIESCEIDIEEANPLQAELVADLQKSGNAGRTIVAFALAPEAALHQR
jgi:Fe-S-cluster containining protein